MRTTFRSFLIAAGLVGSLAVLVPSGVDAQSEGNAGGLGRFVTVTKVVEGDGPTGGFVVEFTCTTDGGGTGGSVPFDNAGPGAPETIPVEIPHDTTTCTFTETESNGAVSTTYECVPETADHACLDDQTVVQTFAGGKYSNSELTVTNTFDVEVDDEDDEPDPDIDADVVDATPTFTG